ncbi:MAG: hypothetical protein R6U50_03590 [Desulfobacterales bacterium]
MFFVSRLWENRILFIVMGLILLFLAPKMADAGISIAVSGSWHKIIDATDLTAGAGSGLQSACTSVSGQVTIDIIGTSGPADAWRVDVKKIDADWDNTLHPHVMRTSGGLGGSVDGGTDYREVTAVDSPFFAGFGDVTGIEVQLRMTGASIHIAPGFYSTVLEYTVVDVE